MTPLQIEKLRKDTPGCQHVLHFNNAGAALPPLPVVNAVKEHLDLESTIGGYEAAKIALNKSEKIYDNAAQLINCDRDEIAFLENATRAWDMAFYSLKFKKGDRILTAMCEYASNYLAFLHMSKHTGAIIEVIRNDSFGQLDIADLQNRIDSRVKLIAITHVPTQGDLINPAVEVGKIAKQNNIPYLLDTTQSVGQMPVDVKEIGCDFLCATGRKYLRGPRGTGFLYARKEILAEVEEIQQHLSKMKINVSISLQEYARLDMAKRNLPALVRASVHYYNTEEEVEAFCQAIKAVLNS